MSATTLANATFRGFISIRSISDRTEYCLLQSSEHLFLFEAKLTPLDSRKFIKPVVVSFGHYHGALECVDRIGCR